MALPPLQNQVDQPRSYQQKLEIILDHINTVAVVYDQNGLVQLANRFARTLFGFDPVRMRREEFFARLTVQDEQGSRVPPEQMPASRAARGENVENVRLTLVGGEGKAYHLMASAFPVQYEGQPAGVISVWSDYTEHKQVQQALAIAHAEVTNEKNRLLAVMDALPVGMAIFDTNGGVIQSNQTFEETWGSPRPAADSVDDYSLYKAWWVHNGQPVQPDEWAAAQAVQNGATVINQFIEIQRFDGTRGYVLNSGAPIFDSQGKISGCAVAIRDITETVKSEEALRASEERFRVALSALPMTMFTMDRDLRYTWIHNPRLGLAEEQILGKRDNEIFPPCEDTRRMMADKQSVLETGQSVQREGKMALDGKTHYYHVSYEPVRDGSGRITGLIGAALDVTEQRSMQDQHTEAISQMELQRRLLEHREQERQEIARDIHDGPIQIIVSKLFHLQTFRSEVTDPAVLAVLDETAAALRGAVQELRDVVNELRPPVLIKFGLARAIQIHSEDFRARYPEIKLELDLVEDEKLLPEDTCLALYRIYQEGLNNVLRHAQAQKIEVRYYPNLDHIALEIKDDGAGFDLPADWLDLTRKNHFGIAGIRERVHALGGQVAIQSEPQQGTRVTVRVPIAPPKA